MYSDTAPLPNPARVLSIYSRLEDESDSQLARYNDAQRLGLLRELTLVKPVPDQPGLQEYEIARVLRTRPYPEELYAEDCRIASAFNRLSQAIRRDAAFVDDHDHSPVRIFRQACQKAISACGLKKSDIILSFLPISFKTKPEPPFSGTERVALACVSTTLDEFGEYESDIWLNTDLAYWTQALKKEDVRLLLIPGVGIHEVSHIDQKVRRTTSAWGSFYDVMWEEKSLVKEFEKNYSVYRSTLLERQTHLRQKLYLAHLQDAPAQREEYYLHQDLGLPVVEPLNRTMIAALR